MKDKKNQIFIRVLYYLKKEKCISHKNIKLENILTFKNNNIFKVSNFGRQSKKVESNV